MPYFYWKEGESMTQSEKIVCSSCGKERNPTRDFYKSYSPFHKHTERMHVCKDCFLEFVNDDLEKLKTGLRMIDKPFIAELLKSSQDEAEKSNKNTIRIYMKNVVMPQYKNYTWDDSEFGSFKSTNQQDTEAKKNIYEEAKDEMAYEFTKEELKHLMSFWGKGFSIEQYTWLQSEYEDWTNRYECDSKGMETLIQEICLTQLDIQVRRENKEKVDAQLKTLQDLLGSSNLKPVQETGANAVEQESFGTLIKKYENEKPIPEPDDKWKDVDGIGKYIRTFFFGHMAKAVGIENKFQDEYEEELSKYTVEPEYEENNEGDL